MSEPDPQSEFVERYAERGHKGDKGDKGERGATGAGGRLATGTARSIVWLFVIGFLIAVANFLFTAHYVNSTQHAQQRAGEVVELKLCSTLSSLAALKPPAGNPDTNPSRAYLQQQAAKLAELGHDLGCSR